MGLLMDCKTCDPMPVHCYPWSPARFRGICSRSGHDSEAPLNLLESLPSCHSSTVNLISLKKYLLLKTMPAATWARKRLNLRSGNWAPQNTNLIDVLPNGWHVFFCTDLLSYTTWHVHPEYCWFDFQDKCSLGFVLFLLLNWAFWEEE